MKVGISKIHYPIYSLGPGKRVGIWFQGCSIKCQGCVSLDTWDSKKNQVDISEVTKLLSQWLRDADGLTVSGGEPFDQFEQLKLILVESKKQQINTLVYTGYSYEFLSEQIEQLKGLVDAIMTDPLNDSLPQTLPLRGSDNQRLFALTEAGISIKESIENDVQPDSRMLDFSYHDETAFFAGVTKRNDISKLVDKLKSRKIKATAFEDSR